MPLPSAFNKLNKVIDLLKIPCSAPPSVWATMALPAAIRAAWTIALPDFKEGYHQIFGKSVVCEFKTEITEAKSLDPALSDGAYNFLFRSAEWVDLAVWYLFLAEVGEDALLDWVSTVYKMEHCIRDPSAALGTGSAPYGGVYGNGAWSSTAFVWFFDDPEWSPVSDTTIVLNPGDTGWIRGAIGATDILGAPVPLITRTVIQETGVQLSYSDPPVYSDDGHRNFTFSKAKYKNRTKSQLTMRLEATCPWPIPDNVALPESGSMVVKFRNARHRS